MKLTLDTASQIFFCEQDFYVFSSFSAFAVELDGIVFPTAEHAYHWYKFHDTSPEIADRILNARSAHDAFTIAHLETESRRSDWDDVKVSVMRMIIRHKFTQHEYVRRKLMDTGDRTLIENSWRDGYWGWGENRDGLNMLGKLWMELRADLVNGVTRALKWTYDPGYFYCPNIPDL